MTFFILFFSGWGGGIQLQKLFNVHLTAPWQQLPCTVLSLFRTCVCVRVCVCVCARARERDRERESLCVCVCVFTENMDVSFEK